MLTKQEKQEVFTKYATGKNDTGSVEVQVALLTNQINKLTVHMQNNPKDYSSNRGLLKLVGRRKKFLAYLKENDINRYRNLVNSLGLRK